MSPESFKRKLTAILSADVKGYSRLMGADEVGTIRILQTYRGVISDLIQKKGGRVVDSPGDNVLAEFVSVVDALESAVEIQRELKVRNADRSESRRMEFRIGINLGDVVEEGERIYGDGVNIAARIEGLAEGGGICISGTAFDHIGKRLPLGYEFMGEQAVKNIEKPVRVYRVLMEPEQAGKVIGEKGLKRTQWLWAVAAVALLVLVAGGLVWNFYWRAPTIEPASKEKMAFPLPDKPSIAVLPFANMSGNPEQEYIADGLSENIMSALSKIRDLLVIARNSTFTYKGKPVKVNQVAEELGVRYVLEGSVQKEGDRVRITAQLIDAIKGHHLWSEKYDRNMKDLFSVQDDITQSIVVALQVALTEGEQARIWHTTNNLEAWSYATKGLTLFQHYTRENNARSRELFQKAIELDPNYALAWISIAWTHLIDFRQGFSDSRAESLKRSIEITQKVAALDDSLPEVHSSWNTIYMFQGLWDKAIAEGERSIALGPNDALSHVLLAMTMHFAGRFEEAISLGEKAMRLTPYYPTWYLANLGQSYCMAKQYEKAIATLKKSIERSKDEGGQVIAHMLYLTQVYIEIDKVEEARARAAEVLRLDPNFSLETYRKSRFYKEPADLERHLNALRKAGLK